MKDLSFGLIMTVLGMGVTFTTLALIALICVGLQKLVPYKEEEKKD